MSEREPGNQEIIEAILFHDELNGLFARHESVIVSHDRATAILSGAAIPPEPTEEPDKIMVLNHIFEGKVAYNLYLGDISELAGVRILPDGVTYLGEDESSLGAEDIAVLRVMVSCLVVDNVDAAQMKQRVDEFFRRIGK